MALAQFLDNAAKYAEPTSPIRLRATVTDAETIFSVHNRGSYIVPEEGERIFQRFYRSAQQPEDCKGAGMGLAIARSIVEAHGGTLEVTSQLGRGAAFTFALPLAAD